MKNIFVTFEPLYQMAYDTGDPGNYQIKFFNHRIHHKSFIKLRHNLITFTCNTQICALAKYLA